MFKIVINDGNTTLPIDNIYYLIGKDGIYIHKKSDIFEACVKVKHISFLEPVKSYAKLNIPKIPEHLTKQMYSFFSEVYARFQSEAAIMIFYNNTTKEHSLKVPQQVISSAHLECSYNISVPGFLSIGTCHSHAGFGAFHSPTDIKDENDFDGLHMTFGNLDQENISISMEVVSNGSRFKCLPEDYLDGIQKIGNLYKIELSEFPEEWMACVEKKVHVVPDKFDYLKDFAFGDYFYPTLPKKLPKLTGSNNIHCNNCQFNRVIECHKDDIDNASRIQELDYYDDMEAIIKAHQYYDILKEDEDEILY